MLLKSETCRSTGTLSSWRRIGPSVLCTPPAVLSEPSPSWQETYELCPGQAWAYVAFKLITKLLPVCSHIRVQHRHSEVAISVGWQPELSEVITLQTDWAKRGLIFTSPSAAGARSLFCLHPQILTISFPVWLCGPVSRQHHITYSLLRGLFGPVSFIPICVWLHKQ